MRFDIITIFSEMFNAISEYGVSSRALKQNLWQLKLHNPRDFTTDNYKRIDNRPYGGGAGMVMLAQPLYDTLLHIQKDKQQNHINSENKKSITIMLSPDGKTFNHNIAKDWLKNYDNITLICGRYEGIDQRFIDKYVDESISIGDIVLSGGELAAMIIIDSIVRLIPEALGNIESAQQDSFENDLLDYPHYTKPEIWQDMQVPEVLMSGNHAKINEWRREKSLLKTKNKRPDLIEKAHKNNLLTKKDKDILEKSN
jgi:tRNA (guanine37-N1)-methyltransferase